MWYKIIKKIKNFKKNINKKILIFLFFTTIILNASYLGFLNKKKINTAISASKKVEKTLTNPNTWIKNITKNMKLEVIFEFLNEEKLIVDGIDVSKIRENSKDIYKKIYNEIKEHFDKKVISNLNKKIKETEKETEKEKLICWKYNYEAFKDNLILYFNTDKKTKEFNIDIPEGFSYNVKPGFSTNIKLSIGFNPNCIFYNKNTSPIDCGSFDLETKFTKEQENKAINYWVINKIDFLEIPIDIKKPEIKFYLSDIKQKIISNEKYKKINLVYKKLFQNKYEIGCNENQKFIIDLEMHQYNLSIKQKNSNSVIKSFLQIKNIKIQITDFRKNSFEGVWKNKQHKTQFLNMTDKGQLTKELFEGENNLTSLTIVKGKFPTKRFGGEESLFGWNSLDNLTKLTLSNIGWKKIPYRAFGNIKKVENLDLSGCLNLEVVGDCSFEYCDKLTSLKLPKSLESIERHAFLNGYKLKKLSLENFNKLKSIKVGAFKFAPIEKINFEGCVSLKTIGEYSFLDSNLLELDLRPCYNLENICEYAFSNKYNAGKKKNTKLLNFSRLYKLKKIGKCAFDHIENVEEINFNGCSNLEDIGQVSFCQDFKLKILNFSGCTKLKEISEWSFNNCHNLISLDLSWCSSIEKINFTSFRNAKIKNLKLVGCYNLKKIDDYAFQNCPLNPAETIWNLRKLKKLEYIGHCAFEGWKWWKLDISMLTNLKYLGTGFSKTTMFSGFYIKILKTQLKVCPSWNEVCSDYHIPYHVEEMSSKYCKIVF